MAQQRAEALYDFNPTADVELKIKKGDVIVVRRMNVGEGWWEGELNGMRGLFPSSYVKLLPEQSPTHEHSYIDRPKTPLTPGSSKKAFMETLLAPPTLSQDHAYSKDRALELFVRGYDDVGVTVGPTWDCHPPTHTISVRHLDSPESRSSGLKRWSSYVVEVKQLGTSVTRKYKHFLWLYDKLAEAFPCISLPPLPVKQYSGVGDPDGVEARRRGLCRFLKRVSSHPVLGSTKVFHAFLTAKDDKDWKIGRHNTVIKLPKAAKKLFGAPVYTAVRYPAYNVPVNQLSSIERFSKFSRLLEMNVQTLESSCQHFANTNTDMLNSLNMLGRDIQRFTKGLQPTTGAKRRKLLTTTSVPLGLANGGQAGFHVSLAAPVVQSKSAPGDGDGEESEEEEGEGPGGGDWNWREDSRFSMMTHDLHEIAGGMRQVSQLGLEHQEAMETQVVDVLRDYSGIIHTLPVLVKLHEEAMEMFNASKEKDSKKEAEIVRQHCDTLDNILLSEFDHFSGNMVQDFEDMVESFLQEQANFHKQLAQEWTNLHRRYCKRLSNRKLSKAQSPRTHSPFGKPKSGSFTSSITSSRGSTSSPPPPPLGRGVTGRDTPPAHRSDLETSVLKALSPHFNDSFDDSTAADDTLTSAASGHMTGVPGYINVERKDSPAHVQAELSDSDLIDPEILKPKKRPEPPAKPPNLSENIDTRPPADHEPPPPTPPSSTPPPAPETTPPLEIPRTDAETGPLYESCTPRSKDATPPKASNPPIPPDYDNCIHPGSEVSAPPTSTRVDISTRYETAFPHHKVTVPANQDPPPGHMTREYAQLEQPHEYANLDVALASKISAEQRVVTTATIPKKSPTMPKKPVPIQRKRNVSDEGAPADGPPVLGGSGTTSGGTSKSPGNSRKPLPPVKPPKLASDTSSIGSSMATPTSGPSVATPTTPLRNRDSVKVGDLSDVLSAISAMSISGSGPVFSGDGGAAPPPPPASLPPPMGKPRPLSSDFTELSGSPEEDELSRSIGAILPGGKKPRSYTTVAQRPAELRKQPMLPSSPSSSSSYGATPLSPLTSAPSSSPGMVVMGQIKPVDVEQGAVPSEHSSQEQSRTRNLAHTQSGGLQTTTQDSQQQQQQQQHKPKVNSSQRPLLPSKVKGHGGGGSATTNADTPLATRSSADRSISQVSNSIAATMVKTKGPPPPKPPRGTLGRSPPLLHGNSVPAKVGGAMGGLTTGPGGIRIEDDPGAPKGREELMRKLSLRRLRIEEQLAATNRLASPTTTNSDLTLKPESPASADNSMSERNSGLSTSSSLSEVVVSYHSRKGDREGVGSTSGSSNGLSSGGYGVGEALIRNTVEEEDGEGVGERRDDNLAKYGIIEDVSGGSYLI